MIQAVQRSKSDSKICRPKRKDSFPILVYPGPKHDQIEVGSCYGFISIGLPNARRVIIDRVGLCNGRDESSTDRLVEKKHANGKRMSI